MTCTKFWISETSARIWERAFTQRYLHICVFRPVHADPPTGAKATGFDWRRWRRRRLHVLLPRLWMHSANHFPQPNGDSCENPWRLCRPSWLAGKIGGYTVKNRISDGFAMLEVSLGHFIDHYHIVMNVCCQFRNMLYQFYQQIFNLIIGDIPN